LNLATPTESCIKAAKLLAQACAETKQ